MNRWKITFRNAQGEEQEEYFANKQVMVYSYISKLFSNIRVKKGNADKAESISELKAWKNGREYTETLNRFLNG